MIRLHVYDCLLNTIKPYVKVIYTQTDTVICYAIFIHNAVSYRSSLGCKVALHRDGRIQMILFLENRHLIRQPAEGNSPDLSGCSGNCQSHHHSQHPSDASNRFALNKIIPKQDRQSVSLFYQQAQLFTYFSRLVFNIVIYYN